MIDKRLSYDKNLEGLRGLCAIVVAMSHWLTFNFFNASQIPLYNTWLHLVFGHEAVLIFFLLSGYVMGLQHYQTPFSGINVAAYLKKRAVRLYPMYILALLIAFCSAPLAVSLQQLTGDLFFTQEFLVTTPVSNVVLWSLSYEVIYYLLFLGIWAGNAYHKTILAGITVSILAYLIAGPGFTALKSLLTGWLFWIAGLHIAISPPANRAGKNNTLASNLAIILSMHCLDTKGLCFLLLHLPVSYVYKIGIGDLLYLPICAVIIRQIIHKDSRYLKIIAYLIPAFHIFLLIYFRHPISSNINWVYGVAYFIIALVLLFFRSNINISQKLEPVGRLSYGIYIYHFPIAYFLSRYLAKYFSGSYLLIIGVLAWITITILLSVITELFLQPRIKNFLLGNRSGHLLKSIP